MAEPLSLAYYNKCNNREKAVAALEKAFALDNTDARILMELDQLYKKLGRSYAERLTFLEKHVALVESVMIWLWNASLYIIS